MLKLTKVALFLLLIVHFSEVMAQRGFYTPKALFIPVHTKPNQMHLSLGVGGGLEGGISYVTPNKVIIYTSGLVHKWRSPRSWIGENIYFIKRNDQAYRFGLGGVHWFPSHFFNVVESLVGFGITRTDNFKEYEEAISGNSRYDNYTRSKSWTTFFQVNVGHQVSKFEFMIALRLSYTRYQSLEYKSYSEIGLLKGLYGVNADPVGSVSLKMKGFKINAQLGLSIPLSNAKPEKTLSYMGYPENKSIYKTEMSLFTILGRLAIQYNFDLSTKN